MLSKGSGGRARAGRARAAAVGRARGGHGWGEGHDPHVKAGATSPKMGTEDTQVQGATPGRAGAQPGHPRRGRARLRVARLPEGVPEYHQVAEESLAKDDIPGGYRFYVKRYFQLIRPRRTTSGA